jgi:hypothetical protein
MKSLLHKMCGVSVLVSLMDELTLCKIDRCVEVICRSICLGKRKRLTEFVSSCRSIAREKYLGSDRHNTLLQPTKRGCYD